MRGLSDVRNTLSDPAAATLAITGLLVTSLSPPQPTTVINLSPPVLNVAIVRSMLSSASGVCA